MWILIKWALIDLPPWLLQALIPRGENMQVGVDFREGAKPENLEKNPRSTAEMNYDNSIHMSPKFEIQHRWSPHSVKHPETAIFTLNCMFTLSEASQSFWKMIFNYSLITLHIYPISTAIIFPSFTVSIATLWVTKEWRWSSTLFLRTSKPPCCRWTSATAGSAMPEPRTCRACSRRTTQSPTST